MDTNLNNTKNHYNNYIDVVKKNNIGLNNILKIAQKSNQIASINPLNL
jgi:hypothetical protein